MLSHHHSHGSIVHMRKYCDCVINTKTCVNQCCGSYNTSLSLKCSWAPVWIHGQPGHLVVTRLLSAHVNTLNHVVYLIIFKIGFWLFMYPKETFLHGLNQSGIIEVCKLRTPKPPYTSLPYISQELTNKYILSSLSTGHGLAGKKGPISHHKMIIVTLYPTHAPAPLTTPPSEPFIGLHHERCPTTHMLHRA